MKINLGFESISYTGRTASPKRSEKQYGGGKTTIEVAKQLEQRYKLVEKFFELEKDNIAEMLIDAYQRGLEVTMEQKTVAKAVIAGGAIEKIEQKFRGNLTQGAYDGLLPGVPTRAAKKGVSHELSHPYAKGNPPRPSFIDTGAYRDSFSVWIEEG